MNQQSMTEQTPISIVIITLNERERLPNLLNDLKQQTQKNVEVLVIDSNSDDDTVDVAESFRHDFAQFQVVKMSRRGTSLGRNTGAEHASHERLLFLDADVRVRTDFIAQLRKVLAHKPRLVAAGLMRAPTSSGIHVKLSVWTFNQLIRLTKFWFPTAVGACIVSSKTVHEYIDGFDERIKLCEDCDYVLRASKSFRFSVYPIYFEFDTRRLSTDGFVKTGLKYFHAFFHRLFIGELKSDRIEYDFGHYDKQQSNDKKKGK